MSVPVLTALVRTMVPPKMTVFPLQDSGSAWNLSKVMERSAALYDALRSAGLAHAAQYAVSMAYRVRFVMDMNAREAMPEGGVLKIGIEDWDVRTCSL